ncbi:alpha/beta fold hydrolase [Actinomycetospora sp. NBRC 106378]|uniref:alpha/beta fold hydrolase n=1 Tax=Actinomycetospora sp. NBRC 106378 TaxID=3032208 RepID=UPI0025533552|nr:alpha/beta fold hydrolase [Actinomycetospora sp. NBRC 106378]
MFFRAHDGIALAYLELGAGRPLVFVHGFTGSAAQLVDDGPAPALAAAGFRVILPDLRAHGDSADPRDASAWPSDVLADDGLALVEALGLEDYDLAGYSLGGRVVLRMLARGARPRRAVIAGQGRAAAEADGPNTTAFRERLSAISRGEVLDPPSRWIVDHGFDPVALLHLLGTYVATPDDVLAAIPVPTLVLTEEDDRARLTAPALAAALGDGRVGAVPGDHVAAMAAPEFGVAMVDFLASS